MRAHHNIGLRGGFAIFTVLAMAIPTVAKCDDAELARQVEAILRKHCHKCHGNDGTVEGGMNFVVDLKQLVQRKMVTPGNAARSKLLRRMTNEDDPMPPADEAVRPAKDEIATIRNWIQSGASAGPPSEDAPRKFLDEPEILRLIAKDLDQTDSVKRQFVRYFTITHLFNAGLSEDQLQTYRHALAKLLNSLSWGKAIVVPTAIDPDRTVFRVDIRDYKWSMRTWTRIASVYPYGIILPDEASQRVYSQLGWSLPYLRADWFVYAASRPPLYHEILNLPTTDRELERQFKVDVQDDIESFQVVRAGFNGSGISQHNRLIERHESPYGAYWKSYDFANSADQKNLFAHPFGPGFGNRYFEHDGGEIIFSLPNGLQAFMLVDGHGHRIDEGPTEIVSDPKQPDKAVVNGVSCMSCHVRGLIPKDDQIREHAIKNVAAFSPEEAEQIKALHAPHEEFARLLTEDSNRFRAALEKTGAPLSSTDPIVALASRFDLELDLAAVAAEASVPPEEFSRRLQASKLLSRSLGAINVDGGVVPRQALEAEFSQVALGMGVGAPRTMLNSIGMRLSYIPAGEFMMGTPDDNETTTANERPYHKVRITKPFYMGSFLVTQAEYTRIVGRTPSWFHEGRRGSPNHPVENLTWEGAVAFCKELSNLQAEKLAGRSYRLPTEAEWEYACRAGTTTDFAFGDLIDGTHANFGGMHGMTTAVGSYPANRFGLFDMHGNVFQFCSDWYSGTYYETNPPVDDPTGPAGPSNAEKTRVVRGGAWPESMFWLRSAARGGRPIDQANQGTGFRVVCVVNAAGK